MKRARELVLLIENEQERFYRIAYSYVKNREDALDIVHNAIVKALQSYTGLRRPEYARTWFCRILINESISFLRKNRRFVPLEELQETADDTQPEQEAYLDLYAALDKLPPELKTVVILRFFEDMKLEEVAEVLPANLSTVKSRLYRALKLLKLDMEVLDDDRSKGL